MVRPEDDGGANEGRAEELIRGAEMSGWRAADGALTLGAFTEGLILGRLLRGSSLRGASTRGALDRELMSPAGLASKERRGGVMLGAGFTAGDWNDRLGVVTVWWGAEFNVGRLLKLLVVRADSGRKPPPITGSLTGVDRLTVTERPIGVGSLAGRW